MGAVTVTHFSKYRMAGWAVKTVVLIVVSAATVSAQRAYNVGTTFDFTTGMESDSRYVGTTETHYDPSFSLYPSISVQSSGPRSKFDFGYAFGWNRVNTEQKHEYQSHSGFVNFSKRFSPRWSAQLSDYFTMSNDVQTFYALRGVLPMPE